LIIYFQPKIMCVLLQRLELEFGFVSNSSTSNFLVIGVAVKDPDIIEMARKLGKNFNSKDEAMDYFYGGEADLSIIWSEEEDSDYVGKTLYDESPEDAGLHTYTRQEIDEIFRKVEQNLARVGIHGEMRLMSGIRSC
jgi:hypothetical protein